MELSGEVINRKRLVRGSIKMGGGGAKIFEVVFIFEVFFLFEVVFIFEAIFLIYSMSRPNLLFTTSKSELKRLR